MALEYGEVGNADTLYDLRLVAVCSTLACTVEKEAPAGAVVAPCKRRVAHFGLDRAFPIFSNTVADLSMVFSRSSASSRVSVSKSAVSRLTAASAW